MKVGLLGGSFDPVHLGHLIKAQDALEALGLERVYFVPAAANPLKEELPVAASSERWAMLELALEGEKNFGLLDLELGSTGPSYSVDTVRRLIGRFPGDELFWIIGTDQLRGLERWRAIEELAGLIEFACLRRPGHPFEDPGIGGLRLHPIEGHVCEISSTEIRERSKKGQYFGLFLPKKVLSYIKSNKIYC